MTILVEGTTAELAKTIARLNRAIQVVDKEHAAVLSTQVLDQLAGTATTLAGKSDQLEACGLLLEAYVRLNQEHDRVRKGLARPPWVRPDQLKAGYHGTNREWSVDLGLGRRGWYLSPNIRVIRTSGERGFEWALHLLCTAPLPDYLTGQEVAEQGVAWLNNIGDLSHRQVIELAKAAGPSFGANVLLLRPNE